MTRLKGRAYRVFPPLWLTERERKGHVRQSLNHIKNGIRKIAEREYMTDITNHYRLNMPLRTEKELNYVLELAEVLRESSWSDVEKLMHFPLFSPRQAIAAFLLKYEIFNRILHIQGSIIECGVAYGSGLMSFALFSAIFEPVNHTRRIIGFDTFEGFPSLSEKDKAGQGPNAKVGGGNVCSFKEILKCINVFDQNRFIGHINKVELVKGD